MAEPAPVGHEKIVMPGLQWELKSADGELLHLDALDSGRGPGGYCFHSINTWLLKGIATTPAQLTSFPSLKPGLCLKTSLVDATERRTRENLKGY